MYLELDEGPPHERAPTLQQRRQLPQKGARRLLLPRPGQEEVQEDQAVGAALPHGLQSPGLLQRVHGRLPFPGLAEVDTVHGMRGSRGMAEAGGPYGSLGRFQPELILLQEEEKPALAQQQPAVQPVQGTLPPVAFGFCSERSVALEQCCGSVKAKLGTLDATLTHGQNKL